MPWKPKIEYGSPVPVSPEDKEYLRKLNDRIWRRSHDRFGHVHSFPKDGEMPESDRSKVLRLIGSHVLPCVLGSGPYGGLFFHVYDHSDVPGIRPDFLAGFDEDHFGRFGHGAGLDEWQKRFDAVSVITHSDRNRQVLEFYGLPEPEPASRYEY